MQAMRLILKVSGCGCFGVTNSFWKRLTLVLEKTIRVISTAVHSVVGRSVLGLAERLATG